VIVAVAVAVAVATDASKSQKVNDDHAIDAHACRF
jgi:hypothetical protein